MIKVSIIMPVYNAERYLSETLDSVINQNITDFELIAINDGSLDGSLEILESYKSRIPNLKIINQANSGVSSTRNRGIDLASGKYICFLDADDYLSRNYLSFLYEQAEKNQSDIICCSYFTFSRNKKIRCKIPCKSTHHVTFADLRALGHATSPCTKLYKREFILKNDVRFTPESTYGEDYFFNWKLYILTDKTYFSDTPLYGYRQSLNGATSKFHPRLLETYLQEYDSLRSFAVYNSLLTCNLIKEIDTDILYRIPSILRMNIRSSYSIKKKLEYIKELSNSYYIEHAARLVDNNNNSYIISQLISKKHLIVLFVSYYFELKIRTIKWLKYIYSILT